MKINILTISLLFYSISVLADTFEEHIVFPGDFVNNIPLESYANSWWQWTYTMPKELSPIRDTTGENCHIRQKGDVWYLAGGYGSSVIRRTCEIPEGKYIFFPIINMVYYPRQIGSLSCEDAKAAAALNNDELLIIDVELDDLKSSNPAHLRLSSDECFNLLGLIPKELEPPRIYPAATDGYWAMLKPLSKGTHTLKFQAKYDREEGAYSKMVQDIEYVLIVK